MKPVLLEFERATEDLARLLDRAVIEDELLRASTADISPIDLRNALIRFQAAAEPFAARLAQYAMQLVLLYGAFERLMEGFLIGTLTTLNELVPTYLELPGRILSNHRRKSLDSLKDDVWLTRQDDPLLAAKLIESLHSCESHAAHYKLNGIAYGRHSGNFRRSSIDEAFREAGVDDFMALVSNTDNFQSYLSADLQDQGLLGAGLGVIDDLAERRNEIAHGSPSQLLTREQMADYVQFFNVFARSSYTALCQYLGRFLVTHHAVSLCPFTGLVELGV